MSIPAPLLPFKPLHGVSHGCHCNCSLHACKRVTCRYKIIASTMMHKQLTLLLQCCTTLQDITLFCNFKHAFERSNSVEAVTSSGNMSEYIYS